MSLEHAVNLNSLRMIREELDATLQRASGEFEAYLADPGNRDAINQCRQDMVQVGGTLRLIEFAGAALLADEMAAAVALLEEQDTPSESLLAALSHAFVALPRYLDFVAGQQTALPILVLPWVNELRAARRAPFAPEYHFENWQPPQLGALEWPGNGIESGADVVKRLRAMFQTGLLAAIKGQPLERSAGLMVRAAQRLAGLYPLEAGGAILAALAAVSECLEQGGLQLNLNRKRSLATAEQLLGRLQRHGEGALNGEGVDLLLQELLFMLALSAYRDGLAGRVIAAYQLPAMTPDDIALAVERDALQGPGGDTIDSVVSALRDELRSVKDTLEIAAQNRGLLDDDIGPLRQTLTRIADTLKVINLNAPASILREQLATTESWLGRGGQVELEEFQAMADALLFIESCLSALARHQLSAGELAQLNDADRDRIIAESHLAEAEAIVVQEAQAGISMAKRAITAYVDSNFDRIHIANVATTLNTVRGGLSALGYGRASAVVRSCVAFVDDHINQRQQNAAQSHQLLETLADALISLEYYLGELEANGSADDKILDVAEESLAALGFAVAVPQRA